MSATINHLLSTAPLRRPPATLTTVRGFLAGVNRVYVMLSHTEGPHQILVSGYADISYTVDNRNSYGVKSPRAVFTSGEMTVSLPLEMGGEQWDETTAHFGRLRVEKREA